MNEVVDAYGNTTRYRYQLDEDTSSAELGRELYPSRIEYTSHANLAAAYSVDFVLDDAFAETRRPDRMIAGRAGFKVETRHLLRAVDVRFQGSDILPIRQSWLGRFRATWPKGCSRAKPSAGCQYSANLA